MRNQFSVNKKVCTFFYVFFFAYFFCCSNSTEPDNFCADPCDIVRVNNGVSITQVDCMGNTVDTDVNMDSYGRTTLFKVVYENGSVEVNNIQYNNNGVVLSYRILIRYKSETITKSVTHDLSGNMVVDKECI